MVMPLPGGAEGADPLDSRLGQVRPVAVRARGRWATPRRLALGLSPNPVPAALLLLIGIALGPHGVALVSGSILASLDPAVSVALAALGVLIGLDLELRRPRERRLLAAGTVEAAVTMLMIAGGFLIVHSLSPGSDGAPWLLACLLGICGSPSSTEPAELARDPRHSLAMRAGDLDDVLPLVLGALALALIGWGTVAAAAALLAQVIVIAVATALAGWLLVTQTSSDSEQRVFVVGVLLLLGGAAAHLGASALFAGFVAGAAWNAAGPVGRDRIALDVRYLQHLLIVVLLIVGGFRLEPSARLLGLVALYVVCRTAGKLVGGWLAGRTVERDLPRDLGFRLLSPGIVGLAFAMNVLQARGDLDATATAFTIVVVGSLASDLLDRLAPRSGRPA